MPIWRKKKSTDQQRALAIRAMWMRATGVPESMIAEQCKPNLHPVDLAEELENLKALEQLPTNQLSSNELKQIAAKCRDWVDDE